MEIQVDPDWWKHLFDEVYLITDARTVCNDEMTCREIDVVMEILGIDPDDDILDLCGGHGRHSIELSRRSFGRCTVFDYSDTLLRIGEENARRENVPIRFVQGDARKTLLPGQSFDHILIMGNSLGYLPDNHADLQILSECHRLLKPGGKLLLDVTDGRSIREKFIPVSWHEIGDTVICRNRELDTNCMRAREMVMNKKTGLIRDKTYSIRFYAKDSLTALLQEAGFTDIVIRAMNHSLVRSEDVGCMNYRLIVSARKPN
jgi:D-alanine-D-alanine ligase